MQPSRRDAALDRIRAQAGRQQLTARNDPVLPSNYRPEARVGSLRPFPRHAHKRLQRSDLSPGRYWGRCGLRLAAAHAVELDARVEALDAALAGEGVLEGVGGGAPGVLV